jgi:DNA-binding MurR/RpiR family transcriptional regulator
MVVDASKRNALFNVKPILLTETGVPTTLAPTVGDTGHGGMRVRDRIESAAARFTASERKLAASLLCDYPFAGLATIHELARRAEVSAPSISRFVGKIGLSGYPAFQRELLSELKAGDRSPVELHAAGRPIEGGYLREFVSRAAVLTGKADEAITEEQFTRICDLLSDPSRAVYVLGGRISDTVARQLSFHLGQCRPGVRHLPADPETWPEHLLQMSARDILFLTDFRRYQASMARLAQAARTERGACVVLMTDRWLSPVARYAAEVLPTPIETGTLWDSYAPALAVVEAIATRVAEKDFDRTSARIEAWDALRPAEGGSAR